MKLKSQLIISIAIFGVILLIISASVVITNQQAIKITDEQQTAGQIQTGARTLPTFPMIIFYTRIMLR